MLLISRSQEKLDDVARSLGKCVFVYPQHHGNLFGVECTVSGLMRMCVWAGSGVLPLTPLAPGSPRP